MSSDRTATIDLTVTDQSTHFQAGVDRAETIINGLDVTDDVSATNRIMFLRGLIDRLQFELEA